MNHYEVLGVDRDATTGEIRSAFRRLARAHHPDTNAAGSIEMLASINEAWRVLGDAQLRRAYDRSLDVQLVASAAGQAPTGPPRIDTELPPSSFPWRFLAGLAVVGIGIVLLGVFTYEPSKPRPPDNLLQQGSCVVIQDNGDAVEVNCDDAHDGVVESLIGNDEQCPLSLEPHRDRQGLGVACVHFDV